MSEECINVMEWGMGGERDDDEDEGIKEGAAMDGVSECTKARAVP